MPRAANTYTQADPASFSRRSVLPIHEAATSNFTGYSLMIRYTDSSGKLLDLHREDPWQSVQSSTRPDGLAPPSSMQTAKGSADTSMEQDKPVQPAQGSRKPYTATDKQLGKEKTNGRTGAPEASKSVPGRLYTFLPAEEKTCTELYLGKTQNIRFPEGIYDNTDKSLISLGSNPRLAGLMCGTGYPQSQKELEDKGIFLPKDFEEYDNLRYTKLKGFKRDREVRFLVGLEDRPEGYPMTVPPRKEGTEEDILCEMKARGYTAYLDYMHVQERCPRHVLALRLGPGYIIMGDMAHNFGTHTEMPDSITRYICVSRTFGLCAILQKDLYTRLPVMCQRYPVCISPDGVELHMYRKSYADIKAIKYINDTKLKFRRR